MRGEALEHWLDHLYLCVKRHIGRYGHRMVQASGNLNQLYVGLEEARRVMSGQAPGATPAAASALGIGDPAAVDAELRADRQALFANRGGPLHDLATRFRLTDRQTLLLVAAAGPMLSMDLSRLYTFAWADFAVKLPSVGFLVELLADDATEHAAWVAECMAASSLVRGRLVDLRPSTAWGEPTPLLHQGVVVPDSVMAFLRGQLDPREAALAGVGRYDPPAKALPLSELQIDPGPLAELQAVVPRALEADGPRPCLLGPDGAGRRTSLLTVAAALGRGVFTVELDRLAADEKKFVPQVGIALREAMLRGAIPLLRGDHLFDDRTVWDPLAERLGELVDRHPGPVAFSARQPVAQLAQRVRHVLDLRFPIPGAAAQRAAWAKALDQADGESLGRALSERFTVTPGAVHHAVADARARRRFTGGTGPVTEDDLLQAVRRRLDHALSNVAEPFATTLEWSDVVLPEEVMGSIKDIIAQAKWRERVFDDWGMRRKMSYGRGLACLFSGPPGTGKTMMAALMAKTLGRELYKVDVSRIVSKWVGETEKNLGRVFDEAEKAQVILLFDEADSLFSSRTEVKGSNDRFANMEVNYLLQRMESYDGMSLLTTNFEKSIDEAFKRRLKFRVHFPLPDADERAELWRRMLPTADVLGDDIDFPKIGRRFQMSGGNIKNAVLRAAFFAADEDVRIDHALLMRAAQAEAREMGRLF